MLVVDTTRHAICLLVESYKLKHELHACLLTYNNNACYYDLLV